MDDNYDELDRPKEQKEINKSDKKPNPIIQMLKEGEAGIARYRNLIGLGVFLMLIAFSGIYLYALSEERKMAENCGFTDGTLRCVCNSEVWEQQLKYQERRDNFGFDTEDFAETNDDWAESFNKSQSSEK